MVSAFVLVILSLDRRKILHTNAAEHSTAAWTDQQVLEAVGLDDAPKYLLHDRDANYGALFSRKVVSVGLNEVVTAPRSPWQNPYVERVTGHAPGHAWGTIHAATATVVRPSTNQSCIPPL